MKSGDDADWDLSGASEEEDEDYDEDNDSKCNRSKRPLLAVALVTLVFGVIASLLIRDQEGVSFAARLRVPFVPYPGVRRAWRQCGEAGRSERYTSQLHVSLLMMAIDGVPHADIWLAFVRGAPEGAVSGYIHCKYPDKCRENLGKSGLDKVFKVVPAVFNEWCKDLLSPMLQLLTVALEEPLVPLDVPTKFVFVSTAHLPVKPFSVVRAELGKHPRNSDFCLYPPNFWDSVKADPSMLRVTANQWSVLSREDAETLVQRMPAPRPDAPLQVPPVGNLSWEDFQNYHCIDEAAVFATIFGLTPNVSVGGGPRVGFYPGVGAVDVMEPREQGCCRTWEYLSIHTTAAEDEARIQWWIPGSVMAQTLQKLRHAPDSMVWGPLSHCDVGCEIVWRIDALGPLGQRVLRDSPFLFTRKVADNATLPGYADRVLS